MNKASTAGFTDQGTDLEQSRLLVDTPLNAISFRNTSEVIPWSYPPMCPRDPAN